ncbi:hypothetical protein [Kaistella pullorum]|uniref:Uncharacterized protein n=1 Tax=Kaistella pullorum TaxID=2763074 RepID=A0ABR8WJ05_9FLAO|nr:hypothetical protein [Kaistella pullorum]MBD8017041.1 hypothetical protein [Kaistella pullorum]
MEIQCRNDAVMLDLRGTETHPKRGFGGSSATSFTINPEALNWANKDTENHRFGHF